MVLECPYCNSICNFKPVWCPDYDLNIVEISSNKFRSGVWNVVMQCDNVSCRKYIFIFANGMGGINAIFPLPSYAQKKIEGVSDDIWIDYIEACKCLDIKTYNATVVMCRRALQNIAIDKGAKKSDDLYIQLEDLKNKGIIQGILYEAAKHIRTIGNDGAHPEKSKVTEDDAKEIKDFTWQIIDYIYLLPARISKIQIRKQTT